MNKSITSIGLFFKNRVGCEGLSKFEELAGSHQIVEELHAGGQFKQKRDKLTLFCIAAFSFEKVNKSMSLEFFLVQNFWKCDTIFLKNLPHFEKMLYSTTEHTNPLNAKQSCNDDGRAALKLLFYVVLRIMCTKKRAQWINS